jgi:transcriptional regulator with XRE-family HTH domain
MEFGLLVRSRRQELGMDARHLEKISGINHGTISRIENGHVHPLIETAIPLINALKIDPSDIIDPEKKKNLQLLSPSHKSKEYLNISDLNSLFLLFSRKPVSTLDKMMTLAEKYSSSDLRTNFHLGEYWKKRMPGRDGDQIAELLEIIKNIEYPKKFENIRIMRIYNSGGVISLLDFGQYVRNARKELSYSLVEVQNKSGLSDSSLCNLENAYYQWIKLSDILVLEKVLKAKGDFFQLIWNVCEFKERTIDGKIRSGLLPQERILLNFIICIYRWLQLQDNSMSSQWLNSLRLLNNI